MPIDIERFTESAADELTEVTNAERVIRFLYQNDDKAFTPSEVAEGTGVKKPPSAPCSADSRNEASSNIRETTERSVTSRRF